MMVSQGISCKWIFLVGKSREEINGSFVIWTLASELTTFALSRSKTSTLPKKKEVNQVYEMPSLARNINPSLAVKNGEHTELEASHWEIKL
jgi:hypothetical protein